LEISASKAHLGFWLIAPRIALIASCALRPGRKP
jgi:hypothetical protein